MTNEFRTRAADLFRIAQNRLCVGIEALDGSSFVEDWWEREGGGGGRTRILAGGGVIEKGGVNFSEVHGEFSEEFALQVPGSGRAFFATGVSVVLHPVNPHVPTVHANFRFIEHGDRAWFGGGADLTPYYFDPADKAHFHGVWARVCAEHAAVTEYERWRDWCDRYFYLPHRGERRGVGGIFFDQLVVSAEDPARRNAVVAFVEAAADSFLDAYVPIARLHADTPFTEDQKRWQELRRGRYVEFNLIHDRGTIFGLKTGGRTESILMSLPARVRWEYGFEPLPGSPEAALLGELRQPPPAE
jgi:coproporphyrinogen III oxidase